MIKIIGFAGIVFVEIILFIKIVIVPYYKREKRYKKWLKGFIERTGFDPKEPMGLGD